MQGFARTTFQDFRDLTLPVRVYLAVVSSCAVAAAVALDRSDLHVHDWVAVVGLAAIAAIAERGRIVLRGGLKVSISLLPAVFAAVQFGAPAAMLVFGASAAVLAIPVPGRVAYLASRALTGAAAAGSAALVAHSMGSGTGQVVAISAAASLTAEFVDSAFASLLYRLRGKGSWRDGARELFPVVVSSVPLYSPAVALLAIAYREVSPWTLALFFVPALAAQRWFLMYEEQRRLALDMQHLNARLADANLSFATALVATLDARDRYTAGHSAAVAIYARDIARRMSLSKDEQQLAHLCGLVHDIGKIGLPAGLLEKPGALTLEERREMQRHSEIGERILANVETYAEIASVVRHHHERYDGEGYPDGIAENDIPLIARIIAVADAYNAMTSDRPYRDAMPTRVARLRLAQAVETQFDTTVVAAFEAILAGADESYRLGRGSEFTLTSLNSRDEVTNRRLLAVAEA